MNCIINKNVVARVVHSISGSINPKSTFSILSGVSVEVKKGKIVFIGTDLETSTIITAIPQTVKEEGRVIVPYREFSSIVKEFPSEHIEIQTDNSMVILKSDQCECKLNCFKTEDYPKINTVKDKQVIVVESEKLRLLLEKTSFCVYREEGNYILSGVLFEFYNEKIKTVATDGKRLAVAEATIKQDQYTSKAKKRCIIPTKTVTELMKNLGSEDVFITVDKNQIGFEMGDIQILSGVIEGEFPEYSQYIPDKAKNTLTVNRLQLMSMLKRASVLSTPEYQAVYFTMSKDSFIITKTTPQIGEIKEECKEFSYHGEPMVISFNPLYIVDMLKVITEDMITIELFSPEKPAVVRQEGYTYLVLPIKIS